MLLVRNFQKCGEVLTHSVQWTDPTAVRLEGVFWAPGWSKQNMPVLMCYFSFRCSSGGGGEAVGWGMILANSFKMTKSSRVRCVSKCVFLQSIIRVWKTGCFCYSYLPLCSGWGGILPHTWTPCPQAGMVTGCGLYKMLWWWCLHWGDWSRKRSVVLWPLCPWSGVPESNGNSFFKTLNISWQELREELGFLAFNVPGSVLVVLHLLNCLHLKLLAEIYFSFIWYGDVC